MKLKVNDRWTRPGECVDDGRPLSTFELTVPEGGRFAYRIGERDPVRIALPPGAEIRVEVLEDAAEARRATP